jgi:inosine/xanthosine triphosphatase
MGMRIHVGSMNPVKVDAVKDVILNYSGFSDALVIAKDVSSGVSRQPLSVEEIVRGAVNRARNAFEGCDYSFGIEAGLMAVPYAKSGLMNICACVIFDGSNQYIGLTPAFEYPSIIIELVKGGLDVDEAFYKAGLTGNPRIGYSAGGAVGILTRGRMSRKDLIEYGIMMAMVHIDNKDLY